jgi:BirA family transcriptional regulator, biotin operon repressor / biotin---[acetyl-CoA-carboxylase] ligase
MTDLVPLLPIPLNAGEINNKLRDSYWRVSIIDETTSTQVTLRSSNPEHGDVLLAEYQSEGRGRLERKFLAEKFSAILMSIYIVPQREKNKWSFLPIIAGLSIADLLSPLIPVEIKWPNDVNVDEKKIAGLLCENTSNGVIVGIGLNVDMQQPPVENATSLLIETNERHDRNLLVTDFLRIFATNLQLWEEGMELRDKYRDYSSTLGRQVVATRVDGSQVTGVATDIDPWGALILDSGEIFSVGDVEHLRGK